MSTVEIERVRELPCRKGAALWEVYLVLREGYNGRGVAIRTAE